MRIANDQLLPGTSWQASVAVVFSTEFLGRAIKRHIYI